MFTKNIPLIFRFSMFNHPEVTKALLELNKGDPAKQQLCKEIARPGYKVFETLPSPRFIKSHFPLSLLPNILDSGCKVHFIKKKTKVSYELLFEVHENKKNLFSDYLRGKKSKRCRSFMVYSK